MQTSISNKNVYGYQCASHNSIFEELETNIYKKTRRIYAVYRYNSPYTVTLSYREYTLPTSGTNTERKTLEEIYKTKASKLTSDDLFEVTYTSPADVYKFVYADQPEIKAKVEASHSKIATDEELNEDFIAEKVLAERFPDTNTYKAKLGVLDDIRAGKRVTLEDGTVIESTTKNQITRKVSDFKSAGFDLLDFDKLLRNKLINQSYYENVTGKPVYTIVKIGPAKDSAGNDVIFKDRGIEKIEKFTEGGEDRITLSTSKAYDYVILYNTDKASQTLNLVFKNTDADAGSAVAGSWSAINNSLSGSFNTDSATKYEVRVGSDGFTDIANGSLTNLMKAENYPSFPGFTITNAERITSGDKETVTLTYERNTYTLSFRLDSTVRPPEKYYDKTTGTNSTSRDPVTGISYGQSYQNYLWETIGSSGSEPTITSNTSTSYTNALKACTGEIRVYDNYNAYYYNYYSPTYKANGYAGLLTYVQSPNMANTGTFYLRFKYRGSTYTGYFTWNKPAVNNSYAFNREGYILTGFKVYHQNASGEYILQSETIDSVEDDRTMPECNVLVEPQFTINPKYLRVEIYYQSASDDIAPESEEAKQYELYKGTKLKVNNGIANQVYDDDEDLHNLSNPISITQLLTKESSGADLIEFLEPYYKSGGYFAKKTDHNLSGSGFNPYTANATNTKKFGSHHFVGNDTMVVALYYDRNPIEFRFHFITGTNYNIPDYPNYKIRSQWNDIASESNNDELYHYSGTEEDRLALKNELQNPTGTYQKIGKRALVKVVRATGEGENAEGSINITYGGLTSSGNYYTSSTKGGRTIKYGITVYYRALYGAPSSFSSDTNGDSSIIPSWYWYTDNSTKKRVKSYCIGGADGIFVTDLDFAIFKYVVDIPSIYPQAGEVCGHMDFYPNYPTKESGRVNFFIEKAPSENYPISQTRENYTSVPDDLNNLFDMEYSISGNILDVRTGGYYGSYRYRDFVNTLFTLDSPTRFDYGIERNSSLYLNGIDSQYVFFEGYTAFAYSGYNSGNPTDLRKIVLVNNKAVPDSFGGGNYYNPGSLYKGVFLMRDTYNITLVDATLKTGGYEIPYLYKQVVPKLPGENEIEGTLGDDYTFDGWYTTSIPSAKTKIADKNGNILDIYKASAGLVDGNNNLLMNHENLKIFANWAPKNCEVYFNPFYPDDLTCGIDNRLTIGEGPDATNIVPYGSKINPLPQVLAPQNKGENYIIETRDDGYTYYVIKADNDQIIGEYKFLGWYQYIGADSPSKMNDLKVEFKANETEVTGHTTLYAKWETIIEKSTYTISCRDYADGNREIMRVERYAPPGTTLTVYPPLYNDKQTHVADNDVDIQGSYDNLLGYEALTEPIQITMGDDENSLTFLYKKAPEWSYKVKTCLNVNGTDVVIGSHTETTTYVLKQIETPDITGYQIYQYQIEGYDPVDKGSTSDPIPVYRPADITSSLEIIIRYTLDDVLDVKASTADYYKYDPLDLVKCSADIETGADWREELFNWEDENYAPAIQYTLTSPALNVTEIIGDESSATAAAKAISALDPGPDYTVVMKLVAVSKADSSTYLDIMDIGETTVTIITSSYYVKFTDGTNTGYVYYANAGSNIGYWYWDAELGNRIGADGASIVAADISELPDTVKANAQAVQGIITGTESEGTYKSFFVLIGSDAYTVVDRYGRLRNGALLNSNAVAYAESNSGSSGPYTIVLYNADGTEGEEITVWIP